jgi:trehalose 2-sulfotransferase
LSRPGTARLVRSDGTPAAATTILPRPIGWSYGRRVAPSSYLLCGTPRTGSTFLCLLASTGVAGRPESYFREPDERWWAERLGVAGADFTRFVAAVSAAGRTGSGVFAARVMWGSIEHVVARLPPADHDLIALERALGPLRLVHLRREDAVAQAVSWSRAEQTGYWQQGDDRRAPARLDLDRIDATVRAIRAHEQAWSDWFDRQGVEPHRVTYEELVRDPGGTVRGILAHLSLEAPPGWESRSSHEKQGDELNAAWIKAYRTRAAADSIRSAIMGPGDVSR